MSLTSALDYPGLRADKVLFLLDRFPLYPTGMDTYRFEYAVFLLNKDIETVLSFMFVVALYEQLTCTGSTVDG